MLSVTGVLERRGTLTKASVNWHSPGATVDLMGGDVRPDGRGAVDMLRLFGIKQQRKFVEDMFDNARWAMRWRGVYL